MVKETQGQNKQSEVWVRKMAGRLRFVPITRGAESYRPNAFVTMIWSECLLSSVSTRGQKQQPRVSHRPGGRRREGEEDCGAPRCGLHPHHHLPAGAGGHSHLLEVSAPTHPPTHSHNQCFCAVLPILKNSRLSQKLFPAGELLRGRKRFAQSHVCPVDPPAVGYRYHTHHTLHTTTLSSQTWA